MYPSLVKEPRGEPEQLTRHVVQLELAALPALAQGRCARVRVALGHRQANDAAHSVRAGSSGRGGSEGFELCVEGLHLFKGFEQH